MKICHINLARGFRGGERQTMLLIETLAKYKLQQYLIARADSPLHEKLSAVPGLTLCPITKPYVKCLMDIKRIQPDLVHAHDGKGSKIALLAKWINKVPYVMTRRISKRSSNSWFTKMVYKKALSVVALSKAVKDSVLSRVPGIDIVIIPSMYASLDVNQTKLEQLKQQYSKHFIVGHTGALVNPHKGQAVLIDAVKILNKKYQDHIKFLLLGTGKDEALLKKLAEGVANIEFVGFVDDVGTWINLFDLFVFPSLEEGLGSSLLDVMQHNKPIVASGVGGILDVIEHRINGLLVPPGDPLALAQAIEEMYLDESLRRESAAAGLQALQRYAPDNVADAYNRLYNEVLAVSH